MKLDLYEYFPISDYSNQVYYKTKSERDKAFEKIEHLTFEKLSHCNMSKGQIRLQMEYYQGNRYNYGIITDTDKKYFIFINSCVWNDNQQIVTLNFTIDVWQTYCYRVNFKQCLVDREHVTDDTKFKYLVDEGMPITPYKRQSFNFNKITKFTCVLSLSDTSLIYNAPDYEHASTINCTYKLNSKEYTNILISGSYENMKRVINRYVEKGKIDSIVGLYLMPKVGFGTTTAYIEMTDLIDMGDDKPIIPPTYEMIEYITSVSDSTASFSIEKPSVIQGYTPRNNKCFNSPYVICQLTNLNGSTVQIPLEFISGNSVNVECYYPATNGSVPVAYPTNVNGLNENLEYAVSGLPAVQIPWNSDTFASYMAQNFNSIMNNYSQIERNREYAVKKNNVELAQGLTSNVVSGVASGVAGNPAGVTSAVMGAVNSGVNWAIANEGINLNAYNQRASIDASLADIASRGDLIHGAFNGTAPYLTDNVGFMLSILTISRDNIKMIDDYFTMFGYKICEIKVPKLFTRNDWNYIKTSGCNLTGAIPIDCINIIKQMFDNGTTLWHDINSMYDYSKANANA